MKISSQRSFTALLASLALVGCATTGSLEASRANYNQAEAERTRAEAEAAAAAKRQTDAEQRKQEAGKALATGLVQAATDDVKAAEAAKERAKAKREEACKLDPKMSACIQAEAVPNPSPVLPPAPAPQAALVPVPAPASPPETPKVSAPPAPPPAPQAEPEPESNNDEAVPAPREAELPCVHIKLTPKQNGRADLSFTEAPLKDWEVSWLYRGVLQLKIDGKKELEVKTARLGKGCWRLYRSGTVTKEECPAN